MKLIYTIYFETGDEAGLVAANYFDNEEAAQQYLIKCKTKYPNEYFTIIKTELYSSADEAGFEMKKTSPKEEKEQV